MRPVRFITPTEGLWSDFGLLYLPPLLLSSAVQTYCVSSTLGHLGEGSPWEPYGQSFRGQDPADGQFLNVLVGLDFDRFHTQGVPNIAITGNLRRPLNPTELHHLKHFHVAALDVESVVFISERVVPLSIDHVPPERLLTFLEQVDALP